MTWDKVLKNMRKKHTSYIEISPDIQSLKVQGDIQES